MPVISMVDAMRRLGEEERVLDVRTRRYMSQIASGGKYYRMRDEEGKKKQDGGDRVKREVTAEVKVEVVD